MSDSCSTPWRMYLLSDFVVTLRSVTEPIHSTLHFDFALEFIRQSDVWDWVPFEKFSHRGTVATLKLKSEQLIWHKVV